MNAIFEREAVRKYTNEEVEEEKIQKLIDAFQASPCAMHQTDVMELSVITKSELLKKIEDSTDNSCYNAPLIFMINTKKDSQFGERDASVAAENVMVEAADLGLGSVYVMGGVFALNKFPELQRELGMDEGYETSVLMPIGYPADKEQVEDIEVIGIKWLENKGKYSKKVQ